MAVKIDSRPAPRRINLSSGIVLLAVFMSAFMAASCSSSDGTTQPPDDAPPVDTDGDDRPGLAIEGLNGTPPDQLASPWHANISFFRLESRTPGTGDATVDLLSYDEDFRVSNHLDYYTPELDVCQIYDLNDDDSNDDDGDGSTKTVSGGQALSLSDSSGIWFYLQERDGTNGVYETDNGLPSAFPADLTLSIPGDVFPSVVGYPLAEPDAPVRLLPTADILNAEDVVAPFTWIPGEQAPGEFVEITGIAFDGNDDFLGFPIVCSVVDDGSFSMPQDVVDAFSETDFSIRARFERVLNRVDFIDGVVFHQRTTVAE